jgi:hypothetical protein
MSGIGIVCSFGLLLLPSVRGLRRPAGLAGGIRSDAQNPEPNS